MRPRAEYRCVCGETFIEFSDKPEIICDCGLSENEFIKDCTPAGFPGIYGDIPAYECPVTGETVTSRTRRREIMKEHNLIEIGSEKPPQLRD